MKQLSVISYQLSVNNFRLPLSGFCKSFFTALIFLITANCLLITAKAQTDEPANLAPPPIKIISKEEKTALAAVTNAKDRTKLALGLMDARLKKAEELNTGDMNNALLAELGGFQAIMNDALNFLNRNDNQSGKARDNFKRFEMALRAFTPRIELIRRDLPERFEYHVRKLLITVRDTRSKAIEPLYGMTVVPNGN